LTIGLLFSYKRSHFIIDMEAGGGKIRQDIPMEVRNKESVKNVIWPAGENCGHTSIDLDYGYAVYDGAWLKVCPFVGVGASIFSKDLQEEDEKISTNMGGLQILAGINLNWKFSRTLSPLTYNESAIRTKIYAARTNLMKGMAPVWSINAGIAFDFYGRGPKKE
jgi:hypothetical protein